MYFITKLETLDFLHAALGRRLRDIYLVAGRRLPLPGRLQDLSNNYLRTGLQAATNI